MEKSRRRVTNIHNCKFLFLFFILCVLCGSIGWPAQVSLRRLQTFVGQRAQYLNLSCVSLTGQQTGLSSQAQIVTLNLNTFIFFQSFDILLRTRL